ncbi:MAG: serine/threonine-protein kinase, partial [Candidatus Methanomethylicaceae archaeon]
MSNLVGRVLLKRFRVDAYIASGGMSVVYKVWDMQRNVPLAMKVLHLDLAEDPTVLKRFEREARALQRLAHPHIVPFYGIFQADGLSFLLEQYIAGPTLKQILRERQGLLPLEEVLSYFKAICSALSYAHNNGVVHGDVKPGNVMV